MVVDIMKHLLFSVGEAEAAPLLDQGRGGAEIVPAVFAKMRRRAPGKIGDEVR